MKYFLILLLTVFSVIACKQKVLTGVELQNKLIETMQNFLNKEDNAGFQFHVKDVNYFADVKGKAYVCVFHVNMHSANADTVGSMTAVISNDFEKVERKR